MKLFTLLLLTVTSFSVTGQQLFRCDTTKSFWAFNQSNFSFSVKLLGNVNSTDRINIISIDNYPLQSLLVDKAKFIKEGEGNTDIKVLTRYAMSEAEYLSNMFKQKIDIQLQRAPLKAEKSVLIWFFEVPSGYNREVKFHLFANIVLEDKIFSLASPQFASQKFEKVRDALMDVISTIKKVEDKDEFDTLCSN